MLSALVLATAASILLASLVIWRDRADAVTRASERTSSISRLIIAHAEAAAAVADRIISVALPPVTAWDLKDQKQAAEIAALLRRSVGENNVVASAAVVDAEGNVLVTSRDFPPKPLNIANRPFVKAYRKDITDPVIMGDPAPGPISGQKRFTFSRAVRNPDGSVRAILNAAIQTASFDLLYREVSNWPGAETGLYGMGGDVLAQVQASPLTSIESLLALEKTIAASRSGTTVMETEEGPELLSWTRSGDYPQIYSATSEPLDEVLHTWRARTAVTVMLVALANILLWVVSVIAIRMNEARQDAAMHDLAVREIHHRLKNSLQLMGSLIRLRARKFQDPALKQSITEILADLQAVAEVHSLLQSMPPGEQIDLGRTIETLCDHLRTSYGAEIVVYIRSHIPVDTKHATGLSIITNELVTNAIKHGGKRVSVSCDVKDGAMQLSVQNEQGALPADFTPGEAGGFGLRAVNAMVNGFGGTLAAANRPEGGAIFTVNVPLAELSPPGPAPQDS